MRTETIYEQEDFDKVQKDMTTERAIEILKELPSLYFPYNMPGWSTSCGPLDFYNYETCVALDMAVEALKNKDSK